VTNETDRKLQQLFDQLREERDELRVRAHLLKAELRDEWQEIEEKWKHLEPKLERLKAGARESVGDIGAATRQLGEEIGNAYRRIRKALQ
jgi:chromosome segregation ATPase